VTLRRDFCKTAKPPCCGNRGKPNSLSGRFREAVWVTLWTARGQSKERFAHTLPTELPTPLHGRPLNSLRFTTVPTTSTTTKNKNIINDE